MAVAANQRRRICHSGLEEARDALRDGDSAAQGDSLCRRAGLRKMRGARRLTVVAPRRLLDRNHVEQAATVVRGRKDVVEDG